MKVFVYTLGCRLNQCESEALMDAFIRAGFEKAENAQESDLVVVNTCTVTSKAEQKARRMIRLFAKSAEAVIVTGCYAEMDRSEIERLGDNIHVYGLREKGGLLKLPEHIMASLATTEDLNLIISSFKDEERGPFIFDASSFSYHSRAYLKIQDGCDNSCSYCRTTIARGPSVSLDADEHFWKTTADNLPWICVRDPQGVYSPYTSSYNIRNLPTLFLINRDNELSLRGEAVKNLEEEVKKLL